MVYNFPREAVEQEIIMENPWQHHTTLNLWELLIIYGSSILLLESQILVVHSTFSQY